MKNRDYFYAAARVAALESRLPGHSDFVKAAQADSFEDACRIIGAAGLNAFKSSDKSIDTDKLEKQLDEYLTAQFEMLEDITGNIGITHIFRYPIDGHNMKVIAKGGPERLLRKGGTVEPKKLQKALEICSGERINGDSETGEVLNEELTEQIFCETIASASGQFARTSDASKADAIINQTVSELIDIKTQQLSLKGAYTSPLGIENIAGYIYELMRSIHACRLTLTLKLYNISPDKITERINRIYGE